MYMSRMIEVGKAANGFVVSCNIPLKPDAKKTSKMDSCCCPSSSTDREYIAKNAKEVSDLIEDIMPLLDMDFKTEDEFDKAFAEATKAINDNEAKEK